VLGHEALLRWRHEKRGILSPAEFIGVGEDSGLIEQVDWLMYARVIQDMATRAQGGYVSVNVSPRHFRSPDFAERLLGLLEACNVDPKRLRIEITEVALFDDAPRALRTLSNLRQHGVLALLDDFGTASRAVVPAPLPDRVPEDRSQLHRRPVDRAAGKPRGDPRDPGAGRDAEHRHDRRRHRDRSAARCIAAAGVRERAGVFVRAAGGAGRLIAGKILIRSCRHRARVAPILLCARPDDPQLRARRRAVSRAGVAPMDGVLRLTLACLVVALTGTVRAGEYTERVEAAKSLQPLGEAPFGERIDLHTGEVTFHQTDILLEGTGPAIRIARLRPANPDPTQAAAFRRLGPRRAAPRHPGGGRWGSVGTQWRLDAAQNVESFARCTRFAAPHAGEAGIARTAWWEGVSLHLGDGQAHTVLRRAPEWTPRPEVPGEFPAVTTSHVQIGCLAATRMGKQGGLSCAVAGWAAASPRLAGGSRGRSGRRRHARAAANAGVDGRNARRGPVRQQR
jgi:hypothetical protein